MNAKNKEEISSEAKERNKKRWKKKNIKAAKKPHNAKD